MSLDASRFEQTQNTGFMQVIEKEAVSNGLFWLYMYFLVDYFLHFSARVPAYAQIRPTLVLVLIIVVSLISQKDKLKGYGGDLRRAALVRGFLTARRQATDSYAPACRSAGRQRPFRPHPADNRSSHP